MFAFPSLQVHGARTVRAKLPGPFLIYAFRLSRPARRSRVATMRGGACAPYWHPWPPRERVLGAATAGAAWRAGLLSRKQRAVLKGRAAADPYRSSQRPWRRRVFALPAGVMTPPTQALQPPSRTAPQGGSER